MKSLDKGQVLHVLLSDDRTLYHMNKEVLTLFLSIYKPVVGFPLF
jgi:hypothetical protein